MTAFVLTFFALFAVIPRVQAQNAVAASTAAQQFTAQLAEARARGCGGQPGVRTPLHWAPALGDTARLMARGESAEAATRSTGYRAVRLFHASMSGFASPSAVAQVLADKYCKALVDPALTEVGFHQQGRSYWVVLAAPFSPPAAADASGVAARVLALTNEARARARKCGGESFEAAGPVKGNPLLDRVAAEHAQQMAQHGYLEHEGRDGSTPAQRIARAGYRWRSVGENIASGQPTAEAVVQGWLDSPPHCATLMRPNYTEMGIAFAVNRTSPGGIYWAQEFARPQ